MFFAFVFLLFSQPLIWSKKIAINRLCNRHEEYETIISITQVRKIGNPEMVIPLNGADDSIARLVL